MSSSGGGGGYKFSNLLGVPYTGGSACFSGDGNGLLVGAGNRVTFKDLIAQQSFTLGIEAPENLQHIRVVGSSRVLIIDEAGHCILININALVPLARISIGARVTAVEVSPDGIYVALAHSNKLSVWELPTGKTQWLFSRVWDQLGHTDRINSIQWSAHGYILLTASSDSTIKVWSVSPSKGFVPLTFVDHRSPVIYAGFSADMTTVHSVSHEGVVISWRWDAEALPKTTKARDTRSSRWLKKAEDMYQARLEEKFQEESLETENAARDGEPVLKRLKVDQIVAKNDYFVSGGWTLKSKTYLNKKGSSRVCCAIYNPNIDQFVFGLSNGLMLITQQNELIENGEISFGNAPVTTLCWNKDFKWICAGLKDIGHVYVWEWESSCYILKDEGDIFGTRACALLPSGVMDPFSSGATKVKETQEHMIGTASRNILATGSLDGKLKLWDATCGRVFATMTSHRGPITSIAFTPQLNAVISASLDGTVRAFDLLKFSNFRCMTAPEVAGVAPQLTSLAIDPSGEIIAAGSQGGDCRIYLWALQTGKLIDTLIGHSQPITKLAFSPSLDKAGILASSSLDSDVRLWNIFGRAGKAGVTQTLASGATTGATALTFDPRCNNRVAVAYVAGHISFWDIDNQEIVGQIDGLRDIDIGRDIGQRFTSNNQKVLVEKTNKYTRDANPNAYFSDITYSGSGTTIVAVALRSAKVCVYSSDSQHLLSSFKLTHNSSLRGLLRELNSKHMTEAGVAEEELDLSGDDEDNISRATARIQQSLSLPGAALGMAANMSERKKLRVWGVEASTDNRQLAVATSHGVFCYTLDANAIGGASSLTKNHVLFTHLNSFAPILVDEETTRQGVTEAIKAGHLPRAMRLALSLNDVELITAVYLRVPTEEISLTCKLLPPRLIPVLLNFFRVCLSASSIRCAKQREQIRSAAPLLQLHLLWLVTLFYTKPEVIENAKQQQTNQAADDMSARTLMLMLLKQLQETKGILSSLFEENRHLASFVSSILPLPVDQKH